MPSLAPPVAAGSSDIFLAVQTKRAGKVKGEAQNPGHEDDIVVKGWHWGVAASAALGSAQATGRRAYKGLTVVKSIDAATTALMAALATNDEVKEAKLTMRKAGSEQIDYFLITLQKARVTAVDHATDEQGNTLETVTLQFQKVSVEYRPQKSAGGRGASLTFEDEILPV
ncbi:Hcp family type VI secretion system effector [Sphaerotilaceae bacterium SBD11-9]